MYTSEEVSGLKKALIDSFLLVETNFLLAFKNVKPETLLKKAVNNVNSIFYIITHCCFHMDGIVKAVDGTRMMNTALVPFLKGETQNPTVSFTDVMDSYILMSKRFLEILNKIPAEQYPKKESPDAREEIYKWIQRITMHYMGHTGQISTLKRIIEDDAQYFMQAIDDASRQKIRSEWLSWWQVNRDKYSEIK